MKIGNIVSTNNLNVSEDFNVVKTMDDIIHGLPTLIIGWDYVDKTYPEYNIMESEIKTDLYWTFKKTEKRDKHDEDIQRFISKTYKNLTKGISYVFIDPLQFNYKKLVKVIRRIKSTKNITFINGDMVYIYSDKIIFGIDLKLLTYIGFDIDKIKLKIKSSSEVFLDDNKILIEYSKYITALENQVKYIPLLYSIKNG